MARSGAVRHIVRTPASRTVSDRAHRCASLRKRAQVWTNFALTTRGGCFFLCGYARILAQRTSETLISDFRFPQPRKCRPPARRPLIKGSGSQRRVGGAAHLWVTRGMTTRKADIPLKSRLTKFVSRESGAAELEVSPDTWDGMVTCGIIPKPVMLGPNRNLPRWFWPAVEKRLLPDESDGRLGEDTEPYFRRATDLQTLRR